VARIQLNLKMPPELVARLREEAAGRGITLTALVEERLGGASPSTSSFALPATPDLSDRLAGIERRLAALEEGPSPRQRPSRRGEELLAPIEAAQAEPGKRLTTPELAELLGIGRNALNNWISRNQPGAQRDGWRLVERIRPAAGGPPRWVWERAETQDIRCDSM